jgi:hypothetical protein
MAVPCVYQQVTDRTERAAVRKNEERKKHDRLSPGGFYQTVGGVKRFFIAH